MKKVNIKNMAGEKLILKLKENNDIKHIIIKEQKKFFKSLLIYLKFL